MSQVVRPRRQMPGNHRKCIALKPPAESPCVLQFRVDVVIVHSSVVGATFGDDGVRGLTSDDFPPIDSTQPFARVSLLACQRESPTKSW